MIGRYTLELFYGPAAKERDQHAPTRCFGRKLIVAFEGLNAKTSKMKKHSVRNDTAEKPLGTAGIATGLSFHEPRKEADLVRYVQ